MQHTDLHYARTTLCQDTFRLSQLILSYVQSNYPNLNVSKLLLITLRQVSIYEYHLIHEHVIKINLDLIKIYIIYKLDLEF